MRYRIAGLKPAPFTPLFAIDDAAPAARHACRPAPDEADAGIPALFEADETAYIHAHDAAPGCFVARIDRN